MIIFDIADNRREGKLAWSFWKRAPDSADKVEDIGTNPATKKGRQAVHKQISNRLGFDLLSADDGAKVVAYEGVGRVLESRMGSWSSDVLAGAAASLIEPPSNEARHYLCQAHSFSEVQAAAQAIKTNVAEIMLTYTSVEPRTPWRLRIRCVVDSDGVALGLSSQQSIDWAFLPDAVREAFMTRPQEVFDFKIYPLEAVGGAEHD